MARRGFFESLARIFLREALKEAKRAGKRKRGNSRPRISNSPKVTSGTPHRTRYPIPATALNLAPRGMHAYPISGETFYPENFSAIRSGAFTDEIYTTAFLIHEPQNPADSNAIAVAIPFRSQALVLGHIPRHSAPIFARYLKGRVAKCGARVYINPEGRFNSVELDCDFPPRSDGEPEASEVTFLTSESPDFSMTQVTTVGAQFETLDFSAEEPRYGIAVLNEGFSFSPEIRDANSPELLGFPYQSISWDFNLFARSYGGQVRVRYKLDRNEKGRPRLALDASVLPKFKKRG